MTKHHTIITIDIATFSKGDPRALLERINDLIGHSPAAVTLDIDEWKVEVIQDNNGVLTPVPGWRAPTNYTKENT